MNEELLAPTVADWLKASDSPPPDPHRSRVRAVVSARQTRQVRRWWQGRLPAFRPAPRILLPTAVVVTLLLATVLVVRFLLPGEPRPSVGAGASPAPSTTAHPIHWQTEVVDLQADGFTLGTEGTVFTTAGRSPEVDSDPGGTAYWTLEAEWREHGVEQRMYWYFASDGVDWWVTEMRTRDGREPAEWVYAYGPFLRTPLGEAYDGDFAVDLIGEGRPGAPDDIVEARLTLDGLRLSISPWEGSSRASDAEARVADAVVDALRPALDDPQVPQQAETRRADHPGGDPVTLDFGGSTLRGRVWPDGTVRILDDGAGNETDLVDKVVVAPEDTVWVARNKAIFALGQEGKYRPPVEPGEERWRIIGLEARPDGSLEVLTWRALWHFDDGVWTELPTPPEIAHESDLDGYSPEPMPDGSVWTYDRDTYTVARYTADGWVEYPLNEILPESFPQRPERDIRVDMDGARAGSLWLATMDGPNALARFDGASWTEYPQSFIKDVLGHEPERVEDILTASDGITWILMGVDGKARDLVRVEGETWSSTPIKAVRKDAGAPDDLPLWSLAEDVEDGAVQLYAYEDEHREAIRTSGEDADLLEFGVFIPVGQTSDGTRWGVGRNKDVGLLMRPVD